MKSKGQNDSNNSNHSTTSQNKRNRLHLKARKRKEKHTLKEDLPSELRREEGRKLGRWPRQSRPVKCEKRSSWQ